MILSGRHTLLHPGVAVPHHDFVRSVGSQASVPLRTPSPQVGGMIVVVVTVQFPHTFDQLHHHV
jgi:hypothetical protein